MEEKLKRFIERMREETNWSKIQNGTGCWSPGQIGFIIDMLEKEFAKGENSAQ